MKLPGKAALVTGAGRGIGEAVAQALAREGALLTIASRTLPELEQVAGQIRRRGGEVRVVTADVSRQQDVKRLTEAALDAYGRIDILVNAAGVYGPIGPLSDLEVNQWIRAAEINLFGTLLCCRAVLPHMLANRRGKIVNFSGGGATAPLPCFSAYGVSKAAVVRLTETLAEEVKPFGIQVNAVAPGAVDTHLQDQVLEAGERAGEAGRRIRALRETGQGGVPRELAAELVVFLAGDDSAGLTGKLIAAPHDGWQSWDAARIAELMSAPWLTLRRLDAHTLQPFLASAAAAPREARQRGRLP